MQWRCGTWQDSYPDSWPSSSPLSFETLRHVNFQTAAIVRPSAMTGDSSESRSQQQQPASYFEKLLDISGVLVTGTLGSASPSIYASMEAEALSLVPYLRPCLMRKAEFYGRFVPRAPVQGGRSSGKFYYVIACSKLVTHQQILRQLKRSYGT